MVLSEKLVNLFALQFYVLHPNAVEVFFEDDDKHMFSVVQQDYMEGFDHALGQLLQVIEKDRAFEKKVMYDPNVANAYNRSYLASIMAFNAHKAFYFMYVCTLQLLLLAQQGQIQFRYQELLGKLEKILQLAHPLMCSMNHFKKLLSQQMYFKGFELLLEQSQGPEVMLFIMLAVRYFSGLKEGQEQAQYPLDLFVSAQVSLTQAGRPSACIVEQNWLSHLFKPYDFVNEQYDRLIPHRQFELVYYLLKKALHVRQQQFAQGNIPEWFDAS